MKSGQMQRKGKGAGNASGTDGAAGCVFSDVSQSAEMVSMIRMGN